MIFIKIDNVDDERLDVFYRINEKQLKSSDKYKPGVFIGESELVINRAIEEGYKPLSFLIIENEEDTYKDIFDKCSQDTVVYVVKQEVYKQLKGYVLIKGILACFERKDELTFEDVVKDAKRIVVLENVENPTNVGAIFRNAIALFADGLLLTNDTCDPLYRRSVRVSMGNVFKTKWTYINKDNYIDKLHEFGFKTVAFALRDNCVDIDDEKLNSEDRLAIIMGSEGYGLTEETINNSDYVVKIKMNNAVDSLNVASASGIALWQLCKNNNK